MFLLELLESVSLESPLQISCFVFASNIQNLDKDVEKMFKQFPPDSPKK